MDLVGDELESLMSGRVVRAARFIDTYFFKKIPHFFRIRVMVLWIFLRIKNNHIKRLNCRLLYHHAWSGAKTVGRNDADKIMQCDDNVSIDIYVPVYGGEPFIYTTLTALIKNTPTCHPIYIIDDGNTEPRIINFLNGLESANVRILTNTRNTGFVQSINAAIASHHADNHCIILNSDVLVPSCWVARLMFPILTQPRTASTTPFTNAGTICSFPTFTRDNELLEELSVEQIDSYFQEIAPISKLYALPTGVGFCMGMNSAVINKIGVFDPVFGRGYCEENDWCMRAKKIGYENVIVPNLFVYHKHGGSFKEDEKNTLLRNNMNILVKKHRSYRRNVESYIRRNPLEQLRAYLIARIVSDNRKTTVVIDHAMGGGANAYRNTIIQAIISNGGAVFLLTPVPTLPFFHIILMSKNSEDVEFIFRSFADAIEFLGTMNIHEIMINNLVGYGIKSDIHNGILSLKTKKNARLIIYMHDYYFICPKYTLLDSAHRFCGIPPVERCAACLKSNVNNKKSPYPKFDNIQKWRTVFSSFLSAADEYIFFSEISLKLFRRSYELDSEKIKIIPHTVSYISRKPDRDSKRSRIMRIGVIGGITIAKGLAIVYSIVSVLELSKRTDVFITIIGGVSTELKKPKSDLLNITGHYDKRSLPSLIESNDIDIIFIPSIWPETFSYTAEEAMTMNMPLAIFNIGAPAERIHTYAKGILIPEISAQSALTTLSAYWYNY